MAQLPADLQHIQLLLSDQAPERQLRPGRKRCGHIAGPQRGLALAPEDPAVTAELERAALPSEHSSERHWHCWLCDTRVPRPKRRRHTAALVSQADEVAASQDWQVHLRGKLHRVRGAVRSQLHTLSLLSVLTQLPACAAQQGGSEAARPARAAGGVLL